MFALSRKKRPSVEKNRERESRQGQREFGKITLIRENFGFWAGWKSGLGVLFRVESDFL